MVIMTPVCWANQRPEQCWTEQDSGHDQLRLKSLQHQSTMWRTSDNPGDDLPAPSPTSPPLIFNWLAEWTRTGWRVRWGCGWCQSTRLARCPQCRGRGWTLWWRLLPTWRAAWWWSGATADIPQKNWDDSSDVATQQHSIITMLLLPSAKLSPECVHLPKTSFLRMNHVWSHVLLTPRRTYSRSDFTLQPCSKKISASFNF